MVGSVRISIPEVDVEAIDAVIESDDDIDAFRGLPFFHREGGRVFFEGHFASISKSMGVGDAMEIIDGGFALVAIITGDRKPRLK